MQLGGMSQQWHFLIGGTPMRQIGMASGLARPGEVLLSPEAVAAIGPAAKGRTDSNGYLRLADVDRAEPPTVAPVDTTPELTLELRRFLPPPVLRRIDAGQSEWLAEFRQVTSVFVNLPRLNTSAPSARDSLQDVVVKAQQALTRYEGTLTRILDDDKGVTLIASFGLPPFAHEEDPYLAVQAAEEIQSAMTQMRLDYGIGVANRAGLLWCLRE